MVALNDIIDQKNKVNTFYAKRMKRKEKRFSSRFGMEIKFTNKC